MEQTQGYCIIRQTDCQENQEMVFYEGQVLLSEDRLIFTEQENENLFIYKENEFHIRRIGEANTDVHLYRDSDGEAVVESEYGVLRFVARIVNYVFQSDGWTMEYQVLQEGEIVLHTRLQCSILKN